PSRPDKWRDIVNVWLSAEVGTKRKSDLVLLDQLVSEALLVVQIAEVHPAGRTTLRTDRRVLVLYARLAEVAHLEGAGLQVLHRNLVRAGRRADPALVAGPLVDYYDSILLPLSHRRGHVALTRGHSTALSEVFHAGRDAGRIRAVIAQARHVEEVTVGPFASALVFFPDRPPLDRLGVFLRDGMEIFGADG